MKFFDPAFQYQKWKKLLDSSYPSKQRDLTKNLISQKVPFDVKKCELIYQVLSPALPHKLRI